MSTNYKIIEHESGKFSYEYTSGNGITYKPAHELFATKENMYKDIADKLDLELTLALERIKLIKKEYRIKNTMEGVYIEMHSPFTGYPTGFEPKKEC